MAGKRPPEMIALVAGRVRALAGPARPHDVHGTRPRRRGEPPIGARVDPGRLAAAVAAARRAAPRPAADGYRA